MYSDKQIKDIFFELERNPKLFEFQFRGFSIYFIIRFYLEMTVRNSIVDSSFFLNKEKIVKSTFFKRLAKLAYQYPKNLFSKIIIAIDWRLPIWESKYKPIIKKREDKNLSKHIKNNFDTDKDLPLSPFLFVSTSGLMTKDKISMEIPDIMEYFHKKGYPIVFLQGSFGVKSKKMPFYDKFILFEEGNINPISEVEQANINQFVAFLRDYFKIPFIDFENVLINILRYQYARAKKIVFYIQKTQCKYVFARSIYSDPWVIMACAMAGVKCVEIQHGVITPNCIYYQSALPVEKLSLYTLLMPDYILTFGEIWKDIFINQAYLYTSKNTFDIGHYDYQKYLEGNTPKKRYLEVLIAGQVDMFDISEEIESFIQKYKENLKKAKIQLVIRPHPLRSNTSIELLQKQYSNIITLQNAKEVSILEALKKADVLVSATSNCLYEALAMGKPAISFVKFKEQILSEHLFLANTIDDLWVLLKKIKNNEINITPKPYLSPSNTSILDSFIPN